MAASCYRIIYFLDGIIHAEIKSGVCLCDVTKCFDTIAHELLLFKLGIMWID